MRLHRQRGEIRQLQRAGISTTSAEALLDRMLNNIGGLCAERATASVQRESVGRASVVMREPVQWYGDKADNPPWIKALAEVRRLAPREGWRYQDIQAMMSRQSSWLLINTPKRRSATGSSS
jgi:hypothetical protein